jgi:RNA polymerase sigma-70 factor (ECF subfamily)
MSSLGVLDDEGTPVIDPHRFTTQGLWARPPTEFAGPPDSFADRAEIRAQVALAIEGLPPRQQRVITLRDGQGWSSKEVCTALKITATNQRVLLHRARSKVRAALEQFIKGEA